MGNQASTHNPELIDTSVDDWYGRKLDGTTGTRYYEDYDEDNDDWAPQRRDPRSPKTPRSRYDEDVQDPVAATKPSNFWRKIKTDPFSVTFPTTRLIAPGRHRTVFSINIKPWDYPMA